MTLIDETLQAPWGTFRPTGRDDRRLRLVWSVPDNRLGKIAAGLLRRRLKYGPLRPFDVEVWGQRLRLFTSGNISGMALLYTPRFLDRLERALLAERLRPGGTFVDVGANEGSYTFWVRSLLGNECRVITVEPDPVSRAHLAFNLTTNNAGNVVVLPYAIADFDGPGTLLICEANRGENRLVPAEQETSGIPSSENGASAREAQRVEVQVRTLEGALREAECGGVDAMKLDVEGAEEAVLAPFFRSAPEELWPHTLLMEFKEHLEAHARLRVLLGEVGYREVLRTRMNLVLERSSGGV